jgi:hypothetical protein
MTKLVSFSALGIALCVISPLSGAQAAPIGDVEYDVVVGALPAVKVGEHATVSLSLLPRAGYRLLADGPLVVRLAGDGLLPDKALLRREDAVDPRAEAPRFELPFHRQATRVANATLTATLTFYICDAARCRPVTEPVYIRDHTP